MRRASLAQRIALTCLAFMLLVLPACRPGPAGGTAAAEPPAPLPAVGPALEPLLPPLPPAGPAGEPWLGSLFTHVLTPVVGYGVDFRVRSDVAAAHEEFEWDFGDGVTRVGGAFESYTWNDPGIHNVRAMVPGHGYWDLYCKVHPPTTLVDLPASRDFAGPLDPPGPRIATYLVVAQRDPEAGRYFVVSDPVRVQEVVDCLRDAVPVQARSCERAYGCPSHPTADLYFLDADGELLAWITASEGNFCRNDPQWHLLKRNPLPDLLAQADWRPGYIDEGRLVRPPLYMGYMELPEECLGIEPPSPVEGNVVDRWGLGEVADLIFEDFKNRLAWITTACHPEQVDYVLKLLAAAPPAGEDVIAELGEDWWLGGITLRAVDRDGSRTHVTFNRWVPVFEETGPFDQPRVPPFESGAPFFVLTDELRLFLDGLFTGFYRLRKGIPVVPPGHR